jgi:hypothetical protein
MQACSSVRPAHLRIGVPGIYLALATLVALALTLAFVGQALAHEEREVGPYEMEVGFIDEPVFVGQKSGLEFSVFLEGEPVEGLEDTLQAEVIKDDQSRDLPISPRFGEPGWYQSVFFPTAEGPYTFHIFGTIEDTGVDESFTSSAEGFSEVEAATAGQFPVQFPAMGDLADQAQRGADAAGLLPVALGLGAAGLLAGLIALGLALAGRRRAA